MSEEAQSAGGGNKLVMILSLVNTLGMIGVIVISFLSFKKQQESVTIKNIVAGVDSAGAHAEEGHESVAADPHGAKPAEGHGGGHGAPAEHGGATDKVTKTFGDSGPIVPLEPFTVNLSSAVGTQPRYLKMSMSFELGKSSTDEEVKSKVSRLRDAIINILNGKKPSDISAQTGRELLKDEIKRVVNGFLTETKVKDIYFTNFAISN